VFCGVGSRRASVLQLTKTCIESDEVVEQEEESGYQKRARVKRNGVESFVEDKNKFTLPQLQIWKRSE
jgi:hypothetical protein